MRREDKDYVSENTKYRRSFLMSLGYELLLEAHGKNRMEDRFMIRMDGDHIHFKRQRGGRTVNDPYVKRKEFFTFARQRHRALRKGTAERRIEYAVD